MENRKPRHLTVWNRLILLFASTLTIGIPLLTGSIITAKAPTPTLRALSAAITPVSLPAAAYHQDPASPSTDRNSTTAQNIVLKQIEQIRNQYNFPTDDALEAAMATQGTSTDEVKIEILRKQFEMGLPTQAPADGGTKVAVQGKTTIGLTGGASAVGGSFIGLNHATNNFFGFGETVQTAMRQSNVVFSFTEPYFRSVNWLDEVAYIVSDAERKAFVKLTTDEERQAFIAAFWLVRDPTPGTPANEFKDEFYARVAYADAHFATPAGISGSKTDRGRMYIMNGPPDEIVSHPSGGTYDRPGGGGQVKTFPFETWRYQRLNNRSQTENVVYEFVDSQFNGDYRLEYDPGVKFK